MRNTKTALRRLTIPGIAGIAVVVAIAAWTRPAAVVRRADGGATVAAPGNVVRGRTLVVLADCGGCHGGFANPAAKGWLAGATGPAMEFKIGPCYVTPGAKPCFTTRPRNLTPDNETGLGRFTERQIFNALRYGLRPEDTPDVDITSMTPGEGNFPKHPHYLAPPMPWITWRHMPDQDLWDIAAYLKRGLKPVHNKVAESDGPPDFWAGEYADPKYGTYPLASFPTANERQP